MGFWGRITGRGREGKMSSLELFREVYGGRKARAGTTVTWATALDVPVILSICRVLGDGVSQVPFRLYQDNGGRRRIASDHPLYRVIHRRPNPWQTSFEFRETLVFHLALCGNAFVFVNRVGPSRKVHELIPLEPHTVTVKRADDGGLTYSIRTQAGAERVFDSEAIWHLRGPSWNTWMGMEAVKMARDAIGLAISLEQGQSDFQRNGAKTSGLYSVKEALSPERYAQLRKWFDEEIAKDGSYRPLILDRDASFTPITMTGIDQQLLETRKFQIEEICRAFRVMPIMVGQSDKAATYASAEQMFLAHVVHTLSPWYERIEQSADVNLLTEEEIASGYYTKFTPNALMRGAAKDRAEFYAKALGSGGGKGWMTQNDVRDFEDMDRVDDDPEADKLPQPVATNAPVAAAS